MLILVPMVLGAALLADGCRYGEKDCPGPSGCSVPAHKCFAEGARLVRDAIWIVLDDSGTDQDFSALRSKLKNLNRRNALVDLRDALIEDLKDNPDRKDAEKAVIERINRLLRDPKYQKWLDRGNGLEGIAEFAKTLDKLVQQSERLQRPIEESRALLKPVAGNIQNEGALRQTRQQRDNEALSHGAQWVRDAITMMLDSSNDRYSALRDSLREQNMRQALEKLRDDLRSQRGGGDAAQSMVRCIDKLLGEKGDEIARINGLEGLREFAQELDRIAPRTGGDPKPDHGRLDFPNPPDSSRTQLRATDALDQLRQTRDFETRARDQRGDHSGSAATAGTPYEQSWAVTGKNSQGKRSFEHGRNSDAGAVLVPELSETPSKTAWERYLDRLPPEQRGAAQEKADQHLIRKAQALKTVQERLEKPPVEPPKVQAKPEEKKKVQEVQENMVQKAKKKVGHLLKALRGMEDRVTGGGEGEGQSKNGGNP